MNRSIGRTPLRYLFNATTGAALIAAAGVTLALPAIYSLAWALRQALS